MMRLLLLVIVFVSGCNMPQSSNSNDDMANWFDVGLDSNNVESNQKSDEQNAIGQNEQENKIQISDALSGTYAVVIQRRDGTVALGSGFLLNKNLLVTNFHVIDNYNDGYIRQNDKSPRYQINEILKVDVDNDVAILRVESIQDPFVLKMSNKLPALGDRIYALGCPNGLSGTISSGIISQFRESNGKAMCRDASIASLYQTDVQITHGSSGGPVLNEQGYVIGIAVGGFGSGLNYLIPSRFIEVLNQGTF